MAERILHFALPESEALALIELGAALEEHTKKSSPLDKATVTMDEQRAKQIAPWERCPNCGGSGWVEDA